MKCHPVGKLVCVIKWKAPPYRFPLDYYEDFFIDLWEQGYHTTTDDFGSGYVTRVYKPCTS